MSNNTTYCLFSLCLLLLTSCIRPGGVLPQKEMEDVLYDMYLSEALAQRSTRYKTDEAKDTLLAGVLAKHNITQEEFDSSLVWYSSQGEKYFKLNNKISKRLKDLKKEISGDENIDHERPKYNGFTLPPSVWVGGGINSSTFAFDIDSLKFKNKEEVDTTAFDFNFQVLGISSELAVVADVCFEYEDTTVYIKRIVSKNMKIYSITKPHNIKRQLIHISGYIHVKNMFNWLRPIYVYNLSYKKAALKSRKNQETEEKDELKRDEKANMEHQSPNGSVFGIHKTKEEH